MTLTAFDWFALIAIGCVTLFTRIGGVFLYKLVPQEPYWKRFFEHLPTALMVALATPYLFSADWKTSAAAWSAFALSLRFSFVVAMFGGMTVIAALRWMA